jgi:D-alanyl-D-alanine carboxypeptidase
MTAAGVAEAAPPVQGTEPAAPARAAGAALGTLLPDAAPATLVLDAAPATLVPDAALAALWAPLGITPALLAGRALRLHASATSLVPAEAPAEGPAAARGTMPDAPADPTAATDPTAAAVPPRLLAPAAAAAWQAMRAAAAADGVALRLVSAYRSVERQAELIRQRLDAGEPLAQVLALIAPPGCSEHHTGRAVDIGTPGQPVLEASFEATPAFAWLQRHAGRFGFTLSYPRGNAAGYAHEPWHWCHDGAHPG